MQSTFVKRRMTNFDREMEAEMEIELIVTNVSNSHRSTDLIRGISLKQISSNPMHHFTSCG